MHGFDYKYETLQKALRKESNEDIVQRYLLDPFPYCFLSNPELYRDLRRRICQELEIHAQDVAIVGSGKLGFSLSPMNIGAPFSEASDIDVLIVSSELFERIWLDLINYRRKVFFRLNKNLKFKFGELQSILFFGHLRMDKLADSFDFAKQWWELFNTLSTEKIFGPRRIRAAIFKSWVHATGYYASSIDKIRSQPNEGNGN